MALVTKVVMLTLAIIITVTITIPNPHYTLLHHPQAFSLLRHGRRQKEHHHHSHPLVGHVINIYIYIYIYISKYKYTYLSVYPRSLVSTAIKYIHEGKENHPQSDLVSRDDKIPIID